MPARNLFPTPTALGSAWGGSGTAAAAPLPAATFAPGVAVTGMDRDTAGRTTQGGGTGNARVSAEPYISATDLDGLPFSITMQLEADPAPTRCSNPVCASDAAGWGVGVGSTGGRVTGLTGMVATTGYRSTKTGTADVHAITSEAVAVTPGETITAVMQVRTSTATTVTPYLNFYTAGGGVVSQPTGAVVNTTANGQSYVRATATVPAGAATARLVPLTGTVAGGATLTATGVRVDVCNDSAMEYSGTISAALELVFRSSTGAALSTITGASITLTSGGAPGRVYATGTAPAGTRRVQATGLFRATAAGQKVYGTAVRGDQVTDAALAYFDGWSPTGMWDGAPGLSTSSEGIDGENYAPNPDARAAFGGWTLYGPVGASSDYVTGQTGLTEATAHRVTQGSTAGTVWNYAPIHAPRRDMSGETWTFVVEGRPSVAQNLNAQVAPLDANGSFLAATNGAVVAVAAGGVLRQVLTVTMPTGTRSVRAGILTSSTFPTGATLTATAARYRRGTWPGLVYANGSSPGWAWDVRDGGTSRRKLPAEWAAATDGTTASSVGTSIGYTTTQYQVGATDPITTGYTPIPVEAAPGGRPGRATRTTLPNGTQRYEHNPDHREFVSGDDVFFSFAFYLDADFPLDATEFQVIEQMHGAPGTGSPVLAFEARNNKLLLTGGNARPVLAGGNSGATYAYERTLLASLERGRWYSCVYRMLFSDQLGGGRYDVWVDGVLVLEDYAPPCGSVYTTAISTAGGDTYRKQGFYHRPTNPGGTIRHAGSAMGNGYAAVDPYRQLAFVTHPGAASLVSGSTGPGPAAPFITTNGAALLTSGSTAIPAGTRQEAQAATFLASGSAAQVAGYAIRQAAAALASGSTAGISGWVTRSVALTLTSGSRVSIFAALNAAAELVSGSVLRTDGIVSRAGATTLSSGAMVYASGERLDAVGVRFTSGGMLATSPTADRRTTVILTSGSTIAPDGRRQVVVDGVLLTSGTLLDAGGVAARPSAALLVSGSTLAAAAAAVRAATAALLSGSTVLPSRPDGPAYLLSGSTLLVGDTRQVLAAAAALTSGSRALVGAVVAPGAAALRSGSALAVAGYVTRDGAVLLRSGTRVQVGALGPQRFLSTVLTAGSTARAAGVRGTPILGPIRLTSGTLLYCDAAVYQPVWVDPRPGKPQVPAPALRLRVANAVTGKFGWELPASDVKWNTPLNKIGTASATLEVDDVLQSVYEQGGRDPFAELNDVFSAPVKNLLVVCLGNVALWGGPLMPSKEPDDGSQLEIAAAEFRRMLELRWIRASGVAAAVRWADATRDFSLASSNPRAAAYQLVVNATTGTAPSGAPRSLPWYCSATPNLGGDESFSWLSYAQDTTSKGLDDLTKRDDGPDLRFDPRLFSYSTLGEYVFFDMRIGSPYLDAAGGVHPDYPGPMPWTFDEADCRFARDIDPSGIGTDFWTPGSGQDRQKLIGHAADPTLGRLGWPAIEVVDTAHSSKDDEFELTRYARARATAASHGPNTWKVSVPVDGDPPVGTYRVGEMAQFVIRRHLAIPPGDYLRRITNIEGDLSGRVTLTCDEDDHNLTGV